MLSEKLRSLRKSRGWRMNEAERRLGITRMQIWLYENGRTVPGLAALKLMAKGFGIDVGELARCDIPANNKRIGKQKTAV